MVIELERPELAVIIGCTGSGKGAVGREVARRIGAEIISLDSMKVYRRMDIGTAKPSRDAQREVAHHLIDIVEPCDDFSVADYVTAAEAAIAEIHRRGWPILVVGGTPLYLKGLLEGLFDGPTADPELRSALHAEAAAVGTGVLHDRLRQSDPVSADKIHPNDLRRIVRALEVGQLTGRPISNLQTQWDREQRYPAHLVGLRRDREDQGRRTNERVRQMLVAGLRDEVSALLTEPKPMSATARQAVGYAEMIDHIQGRLSLDQAVERIKINTRRFAKSQRTWFKRFRDVEWIDVGPEAALDDVADEVVRRLDPLWSH